jgi:hypothetical protein
MNVQRLILAVMVLCVLSACEKNEEPMAGGMDHSDMDHAGSPAVPPVTPEEDVQMTTRSSATMKHMHAHVDQLERLQAALADGDLEAAGTPAYWLSKHETLAGLPTNLQPHLDSMRAEANTVGQATDLATARAAAQRLEESCEACHSAVN